MAGRGRAGPFEAMGLLMELLIFVADNGRWKAGDVVVACPDGHEWGREELANPEWRVVRADIIQTMADVLAMDKGYRVNLPAIPFGEIPEYGRDEFIAMIENK
jgi:hypothetical protein